MSDLTVLHYQSLFVGGIDGGKIQDGSAALTAGEVHMIEILTDATTFSVLTAESQADATVNMLTANNLTAKEFAKGQLVFAPYGGYLSAFTASEDVRYFQLPSSNRKRNES